MSTGRIAKDVAIRRIISWHVLIERTMPSTGSTQYEIRTG